MSVSVQPMFPDSGADAAKLQGWPVSVIDPSNGDLLVYNSVLRQYVPVSKSAAGLAELSGGTFSGNLTLNGTANTAPNQTAASGSSLMTRDLADSRAIWRRSNWLDAVTYGSVTSPSLSGTGANVSGITIVGPSTAGYARGSITDAALLANAGDYSSQIKLSTPFFIGWKVTIHAYHAAVTYRLLLGTTAAYTNGEPDFDSFGFRIVDTTLQPFCRNGTTPVYLAGVTLTKKSAILLGIYNNGSVLEYFVNGISLGTLGIPTAVTGSLGGTPIIYGVVENTGALAATRYMQINASIISAPSQFAY